MATAIDPVSGPGRARVLVVDDDATVAEVVGTYLQRAGYTVDHAVDGSTALATAAAPPSLPRIGTADLAQVAAVVLETDGTLSVVPRAQAGDRSALNDVQPTISRTATDGTLGGSDARMA